MTFSLLFQMAFGTNVEVLDGKVKIKIPPGTQSGKIFRLKGSYFPEVNGHSIRSAHSCKCTCKTVSTRKSLCSKRMNNFKPHPDKMIKVF